MIYPGAKFLSNTGPMKLENNLSAPKMQGWTRHGILVIDTPVQKGKEKKKRKKKKNGQSQAILKLGQEYIRF